MRNIRTVIGGLAAAVTMTTVGALSGTAGAITFGQPDPGNLFPSVGGLVAEIDREGVGTIERVICTGTMIDATTFLTAAHCLEDDFRETDTLLRFGVTFLPDATPVEVDGDTSSVTWGVAAYVSPRWGQPTAGDPGDVGVLVLASSPGVPTSTVAAPGTLDAAGTTALRRATFTTAGYGVTRNSNQGGNWAIDTTNLLRQWATQTYQSRSASILKLSMNPATGNGGTCYGDSGGPHFLGGVIVSITSTGDTPCKNLDTTYRVDTAAVHAFLDDPASVGVETWTAT